MERDFLSIGQPPMPPFPEPPENYGVNTGNSIWPLAAAAVLALVILAAKKKKNPDAGVIAMVGTGIVSGVALGVGFKMVDALWKKYIQKDAPAIPLERGQNG